MPPWHADAPHGTFVNERRLSAAQKDLIARWVAGGAPQGNPADLPPRPTFADGWTHRHARSGVRAARGLRGPGAGHDPVPRTSTSRPDSPRRSGCRRSKRGPAIARWCITSSSTTRRRPTARAPRRSWCRTATTDMLPRREAGRPAAAAADRTVAPARHLRARAPIRRCSQLGTALRLPPGGVLAVPDALHRQRHGRHRSIEGRPHLREAAASHARCARRQFLNARLVLPPGAADEAVDDRRRRLRRTRSCGASSRTRTCAASSGATC